LQQFGPGTFLSQLVSLSSSNTTKIDHEMRDYSQLFQLYLGSLRHRSHSPWWRTLTRRLHFGQEEWPVLGKLTQIR
jgi:hypothetical protein